MARDKKENSAKIDTMKHGIASVYSRYALLELAGSNEYAKKNPKFKINDQPVSLEAFMTQALRDNSPMPISFTMNKKTYKLQLNRQSSGSFEVHITEDTRRSEKEKLIEKKEVSETSIHALDKYEPEDLVKMINETSLSIHLDQDHHSALSTRMGALTLGGPDKLAIYPLHLKNLYTMYQNICSKNPNPNQLIAMSTGAGKSVTQALWLLAMYKVEYNTVFTVLNEQLAQQLYEDFTRVLPDEVTQALCQPASESGSQPKTLQKSLPSHHKGKVNNPFHRIMTADQFFTNEWSQVYNQNRDVLRKQTYTYDKLSVSIDEEHDIMRNAKYRERIERLNADHHPLMFLSATPSEHAYHLCGGKTVASLSKADKVAQGYSKTVRHSVFHAAPLAQQSRSAVKYFKGEFVEALERQRVSAAHTYADQMELAVHYRDKKDPFYVNDKQDLHRFARWNIQCPIGDKALILASQHDPVVNLSLVCQGDTKNPYRRGNRVNRGKLYTLFQLGDDLDETNYQAWTRAKHKQKQQSLQTLLKRQFPNKSAKEIEQYIEDNVDLSETAHYCEFRVYHGLLDLSLSCLTGLSPKDLDELRHKDMPALLQQVQSKLATGANIEALQNFLVDKKKIKPELAQRIAPAMLEIVTALAAKPADIQRQMVDNWSLDKQLHALFLLPEFEDCRNWAQNFKTMFVMSGLEQSETAIPTREPFVSLSEQTSDLATYQYKSANKHELSAFEVLDPTATQFHYTVKKPEIALTMADTDTLFKLGLVGTYVTSEKTTGFNDPNLHHVGLVLDQDDTLNEPNKIIQTIGRLRGLNFAQDPYFVMAEEEGVATVFAPQILDKKNYFPDLFASRKKHHKAIVTRMSEKIAQEIEAWLQASMDPTGWVDPLALKERLHKILLREFQIIYDANGHDFEGAKTEFLPIFQQVELALQASAKNLEQHYQLGFFQKCLAYVIDCALNFWYSMVTSQSQQAFTAALAQETTEQVNERTYAHIIQTFDFRKLAQQQTTQARFLNAIQTELNHTQQFIQQHPSYALAAPQQQLLNDAFTDLIAEHLVPFLNNGFEQQKILDLIRHSQVDWSRSLERHPELLQPTSQSQWAEFPPDGQPLQANTFYYREVPGYSADKTEIEVSILTPYGDVASTQFDLVDSYRACALLRLPKDTEVPADGDELEAFIQKVSQKCHGFNALILIEDKVYIFENNTLEELVKNTAKSKREQDRQENLISTLREDLNFLPDNTVEVHQTDDPILKKFADTNLISWRFFYPPEKPSLQAIQLMENVLKQRLARDYPSLEKRETFEIQRKLDTFFEIIQQDSAIAAALQNQTVMPVVETVAQWKVMAAAIPGGSGGKTLATAAKEHRHQQSLGLFREMLRNPKFEQDLRKKEPEFYAEYARKAKESRDGNSVAEDKNLMQKIDELTEDETANQLIKRLIVGNVGSCFLPTDLTVFLDKHVEELQYTHADSLELYQAIRNKDVAHYEAVMRKGVPSNLTTEMPSTHHAREAQIKNDLLELESKLRTAPQDRLPDVIDKKRIQDLLNQSIERFVADKTLSQLFADVFDPLSEHDILNCLQVIYPPDDAEKKYGLLQSWRTDLKQMQAGKLSTADLLKRYASLPDSDGPIEMQQLPLFQIQDMLVKVGDEIMSAVCYYQGTDKTGQILNADNLEPNKPQLKVNPDHPVWAIHRQAVPEKDAPKHKMTWSEKQTKMRFLFGVLDAFGPLNRIEHTRDLHLQQQLQHTAKERIQPMHQALSGTSKSRYTDSFIEGMNRDMPKNDDQTLERPKDDVEQIRRHIYKRPR